mmetsp:Transcript_42215/g.99084  ORF Transcript_42215/g.99084 Transcript_42215/m.99084 type:complete len:204 (+) Transcript_42215:265-876(+)
MGGSVDRKPPAPRPLSPRRAAPERASLEPPAAACSSSVPGIPLSNVDKASLARTGSCLPRRKSLATLRRCIVSRFFSLCPPLAALLAKGMEDSARAGSCFTLNLSSLATFRIGAKFSRTCSCAFASFVAVGSLSSRPGCMFCMAAITSDTVTTPELRMSRKSNTLSTSPHLMLQDFSKSAKADWFRGARRSVTPWNASLTRRP